MPTNRKRILICNDAHFLYTGYGTYGKEILSRLSSLDKYDMAELACYGNIYDSRDTYGKWKYYANSVNKDHKLWEIYNSHPQNEFGRWRFERVCLDFKPDIVINWRDPWMMFENTSPLRPFFNYTVMPTVDSAPQQEDWLDLFIQADGVLTYSNFGKYTLEKESGGLINVFSSAPPGVNLNVMKPVQDKMKHREIMGFPNANIIGTIMRNQYRKLYPDLFIAFKKFIDKCYAEKNIDLANNTFLYIHCSYPDLGWEIPSLLKEHGLGRKVIFTYVCKNCDNPFCSFFRDAKTVCPRCSHVSAILPNPNVGLTPKQINDVLNVFDVYIQYSTCEGFGMPQVEAMACGLPVMTIPYSAMQDIVDIGGIGIPIDRMFRDPGTNSYRALPNNELCANKIYEFFRKPYSLRRVLGNKMRKVVEEKYNWDNTAKIWERYIDSVELTGLQGKWDAPMRDCGEYKGNIPDNLSNAEYVEWLIINIMKEPSLINTRMSMKMLRELNYGGKQVGREMISVNRSTLMKNAINYLKNKTECEMARIGNFILDDVDFIEYAQKREKYLI